MQWMSYFRIYINESISIIYISSFYFLSIDLIERNFSENFNNGSRDFAVVTRNIIRMS